jgi:hypothetical protein
MKDILKSYKKGSKSTIDLDNNKLRALGIRWDRSTSHICIDAMKTDNKLLWHNKNDISSTYNDKDIAMSDEVMFNIGDYTHYVIDILLFLIYF